ncbi:hypothetical protein [uncultured Psychroserpens sp.]|uniref:hypothetical protein n=1 Tax=uncultured Psychroserpens sp. TaxID=255436 RepID=UPI0026343389|nr:hypothetical protein [uncultured Psychroserpens sp.]
MDEDEVIQGEPLSEEDKFYLDWAKENLKENVKLANDILKLIITLSSGILGISLVFDQIMSNNEFKLLSILLFFISLIIAFIGVLPLKKKIDILSPSEIRDFEREALKHKLCFLRISGIIAVLGFTIIIAELIIKLNE